MNMLNSATQSQLVALGLCGLLIAQASCRAPREQHKALSASQTAAVATPQPAAQAPAAVATPQPAAKAGVDVGGANEHKAITTERLEPYECGTITRLHTFQGVFLASQPKPEDFEQAKRGGVKTVINLRHAGENKEFDEQAVVAGLGLNYVHEPWDGPEQFTDQVIDSLRTELLTAERPILLHCASANRVGAIWLPFRVLDGGLSWDEALAEAKLVGLKSPDYEKIAKAYIERRLGKR